MYFASVLRFYKQSTIVENPETILRFQASDLAMSPWD